MKNLALLERATMEELKKLDRASFFEYWDAIQDFKVYIHKLEEKLSIAAMLSKDN